MTFLHEKWSIRKQEIFLARPEQDKTQLLNHAEKLADVINTLLEAVSRIRMELKRFKADDFQHNVRDIDL